MEQRAATRHDGISQALHWGTAVLVVWAFTDGPGKPGPRVYLPSHDFERQLHETLGLCVLALVVVRILWRKSATRPAPREGARWMDVAAKATHWTLYALLFAVPATAIIGAWLEGHPLTFLGGLAIPTPFSAAPDAGRTIGHLHTWLGDAIIWVGAFHGLAALYHHVVLRDSALVSMLPRWFPVGTRSRD
jgi:cytochrome b561